MTLSCSGCMQVDSPANAKHAQTCTPHRTLNPCIPSPPPPHTQRSFVSNLDYTVTDVDIRELFGAVGAIKDAGIHYDARCEGCVYVCGGGI